MADIPENVDLRWIARTLAAMQDDMRSVKDQLLVQSGILIRLEHRDRTADGDTASLSMEIQRLRRRVEVLEEKIGGK